MAQCPDDHPQGETRDAEYRSEEDRGADDRQVVDERRDGTRGETPLRIEQARRDGGRREQDRAEQHDPRQLDRPLGARRVEAHDRGDQDRGRDGDHDRQHQERREDQGQDRRCDAPGSLVLALGMQAGDNRHQGRGHRARGNQLEHEIG